MTFLPSSSDCTDAAPAGIRVKICGLSRPAEIEAATEAGADYVGFVFCDASPRNVSPELAGRLNRALPENIVPVAMTVDAGNDELDSILDQLPAGLLQLHGSETPARVEEVRKRYGIPVMKAVGIREASDLDAIPAIASVADQLLIDAKPVAPGNLPGGNGLAFDWELIADASWKFPWMLAGGLDASNVATAIRMTGAVQVDVSTGVESEPGRKSPDRIREFLKAAKGE